MAIEFCKATPATHHLINAEALGRMKQGVMLIYEAHQVSEGMRAGGYSIQPVLDRAEEAPMFSFGREAGWHSCASE